MAVTWTSQQMKVIESRNRNLLVSAAAGSGKTAVLVERIIRMISDPKKPLSIDQLLVMTFTNAAASEMRERIGAAVDNLILTQPMNEHLWLQAALVPQAQIGTIDGFCLQLIRNHYSTLEIDPAFRIGDEGELSLLQADVMGELLEERYQSGEEQFGAFVEQFGRGKSDAGIEQVILQAWQFAQSHPWPMEWLASCKEGLKNEAEGNVNTSAWMDFVFSDVQMQMEELLELLEQALDICRQDEGALCYEPMLLNDCRRIRAIQKAARDADYEKLWSALNELTFDRLAAARGSKNQDPDAKAYAADLRAQAKALRDRVKKVAGKCQDRYAAQNPDEMAQTLEATAPILTELFELTEAFDEKYTQKKRERNVLDFNDLEHLALEVLYEKDETGKRRFSKVSDELAAQYEEILVDEYQDSNLVQEALLAGISRERFGSPNVFMVGDVKQSIYRFRLARPELFLEKYGQYTEEESAHQKIELRQNFRSRATVLESVNDVFFRLMTKKLGGIRYTQETALHSGASFPEGERTGEATELLLADSAVQTLKQLDEDAMDYTAKELEARMIAGKIRQMLDPEKGLCVLDKKTGQYRPARLGDMVILLRSMTGWSEIFVNVLMNEGIAAKAQTKTGYFNAVEVETMLSLLAVTDNPIQDIPLAAVLRSPIGQMTDEELAWLSAAQKNRPEKGQDRGIFGALESWKKLGKGNLEIADDAVRAMDEKIARFCALLEQLQKEAAYLPVHQLIERAMDLSGYYDYVSAMPAGNTRRANLDMLVEKAVAYEATSYKGLFHFIRYIEKLKKYNTDFGEAGGLDEGEDVVQIMSIHKSKGLEFPVVFLAGLGKRFNRQDINGALLLDADLGAAADWIDQKRRLKVSTLKKQVFARRMELESLGEELRVLYVAMTRAKEKLVLTATVSNLEARLENWAIPADWEEGAPSTVLTAATCPLDWLLLCAQAASIQVKQVNTDGLVGEEVLRQAVRHNLRETLLSMDGESKDNAIRQKLENALSYEYPYQSETGLYAMLSVSELKKQGQVGQDEEAIGTSSRLQAASIRGTAYHRALELLDLGKISKRADIAAQLQAFLASGHLEEEAFAQIDPGLLWNMILTPLGARMVQAYREGQLFRERQFIIGIPAKELGKGSSDELVMVQGVIDAWIEEADGLILIDYKTDRVPRGTAGREILVNRYRTQLACYKKALEQVTGKKVKESVLFSLALLEAIPV